MSPSAPVMEPAGCKPVPLSVTFIPPAARQPHRGSILHVDDDPMARSVFSGWLEHHHYRHHHAGGPAEADAMLATNRYDIILSDIHMPGNNRLEWVEQVLNRETPPAIILMTGQPEFETACRAANLPVAGYLLKPADFSTLDATLQRVLEGQRRRAEFLSLSHDILHLLGTHRLQNTDQERLLVEKLAVLARCFGSRKPEQRGETSSDFLWRAAIVDTIAVIEKTKHSFRSKDLGQLRLRLEQLLGTL